MFLKPISLLFVAVLSAITFLSCNNAADIPFPEKEYSYAQPASEPLHFSAEKKLKWDTLASGKIGALVKKLDIDALPSERFDSTGFAPLNGAPVETKFDFARLPSKPFDLDKLPDSSFHFKTSLLLPPAITKTISPSMRKNNPLAIYDLGEAQGLPVKFVTSLLKDKNGLLWIGSGEGIFRYDGEYAQMVVPPPFVQAPLGMAQDSDGNIWFVDVGRIGLINLTKGTVSYSTQFGTLVNNVCKIIKDENGRLWLAKSSDKKVKVINPGNLTFKSIDSASGIIVHNGFPMDLAEDNNKNIWITTSRAGAQIISLKENKIKYLDKSAGLPTDTLSSIAKDNSGNIWVGAKPGGINKIDPVNGTITKFDISLGFVSALSPSLTCDDQGKMWMTTSIGTEVLDPYNNMVRFIPGDYTCRAVEDDFRRMWIASVTGLSMITQNAETVHPYNNRITSVMEDAAHDLWIATQNGVAIINFQKRRIYHLDESHGLSNNFVQSFTNTNGNIIVSTNGGFNIIDPIKKTIAVTRKTEGLLNDTIYNAFKDRSGNIWLTGPSHGITVLDSANKIVRHLDVSGGLSDYSIQDIKQDNNGLIWIATNFNGVNVIDPDKNTVRYINEAPGLRDTCNRMMIEDKQGRMWIGTDKGVYAVDMKGKLLTNFTKKEGLSDNRILSMLEYNGNILAGTNHEITMISPPEVSKQGWQLSILRNSEGLVKQDPNSWSTDAVTSKGEYIFGDLDLTILHNISASTDSAVTYITGMTVMTKPQYFTGKIWSGAMDTLWAADTFFTNGNKPLKTGYSIDNNFKWDSVSGPYNIPIDLKLPYNQNYIQFQFAQAHLGRPDSTAYSYILEGIDNNWSPVTTKASTENYLNLPPGNYTFKVCGRSLNRQWSPPAIIHFTIMPPWYATWWAYTLYALLAIGVLRGYILYRQRQLKKENRLLEEKVELRTKQLQQSIEDLKATQTQLIQSEKMASLGELTAGIAHEIQNPLNFVNNFSEVNREMIDELQAELKNGNVDDAMDISNNIKLNEEKINHHGRRADAIVKSMLQHSRASTGKKEPTDINALADEYLRLSYHGLRAKDKSFNVTLQTDFDKQIEKINIVQQDIGRVLLNLFNNAFYTVNEKKNQLNGAYVPSVLIHTKRMEGKVEIRVKDNGNGIPQKVLDKIFQPFFTTKPSGQGTGLGLSLSYDIIKAHGGEINVETRTGEGSEFVIILPA
jgi:signal transduction histidine kinase/streptogramin lyase